MIILSFLTILVTGMGCVKEPLPLPCTQPDCVDTVKGGFKQQDSLGVLPILWYQIAHSPDTSGSHQWCFATDDGVLIVNQREDGHNKPYVRFLDKNTGHEKWFWDGLKSDTYTDIQFDFNQGLIMVKSWNNNSILNFNNGEVYMHSSLPQASDLVNSPQGKIIGNYFYTSVLKKFHDSKNNHDYCTIIRTGITDGTQWENIYMLFDKDIAGYTPDFSNIELWIHPDSKDSIIFINNRLFHWERYEINGFDGTLERTDLIAYNLNKRNVEWTIDSVCKVSSIINPFYILNQNLFFNTHQGLSVISLMSGKVINDKILAGVDIVNFENNELIGRQQGKIVKFNDQGNLTSSFIFPYEVKINGFELFEGYLYFASEHGNLYVVNAETGKVVFNEFSGRMLPRRSILGMRGRASVDKVNRLLYCSDLWGTYCLKLPDKWE